MNLKLKGKTHLLFELLTFSIRKLCIQILLIFKYIGLFATYASALYDGIEGIT